MTTSLLDLYDYAENNGIQVDSFDLDHKQSLSIQQDGISYIAINPMKLRSSHEEKVCLAHEIGHDETGSFYNLYSLFDLRQKHENRANRWAITHLIPYDSLCVAFKKGIVTVWELAEHFEVTEDFIKIAVEHYKNLQYQ